MSDITKAQYSLAVKAKYNKQHRFEHLYRLTCREEWVTQAVNIVLSNKGSRTAGVDGLTKEYYASETARKGLVQQIQQELREHSFRPQPSRRIYVPKVNGKKRPIGISTVKDRAVQMLLKMTLEPIYESDFLNCSNGFRPGRRTMDCIALLDSYINRQNKFYWVIEGDIRGAYDHINQEILVELVNQRIADPKILHLIEKFLKAGIQSDRGGHTPRLSLLTHLVEYLLASIRSLLVGKVWPSRAKAEGKTQTTWNR